MSAQFLEGRTALVTGSTSGIGLAIAKALGSAGANVAVHGLATPEETQAAVDTVKDAGAADVEFFEGDLRKPDAIDSLIDAVKGWGAIDILVNNAGVQRTVSLKDADAAIWDLIIAVNLSAAFHTMRRTMPAMGERGFGRVINISSVHGLVASPEKSPYVASKFGVIGLSKVAALEYADAGDASSGGVTVNCICPGWVETPLVEPQIQDHAREVGGDRDAGIEAMVAKKQPSKRLTTPDEIGDVALWLCNRAAHNITGTSIPVDGAWTAQ
jgi:3-hydroxybutyrate dehydrogenase